MVACDRWQVPSVGKLQAIAAVIHMCVVSIPMLPVQCPSQNAILVMQVVIIPSCTIPCQS